MKCHFKERESVWVAITIQTRSTLHSPISNISFTLFVEDETENAPLRLPKKCFQQKKGVWDARMHTWVSIVL